MKPRNSIILVLTVVAAITWRIAAIRDGDSGAKRSSGTRGPQAWSLGDAKDLRTRGKRFADDPEVATRRAELERLKKAWMTAEQDGTLPQIYRDLVNEAVSSLLCTEELVLFIDHLRNHGSVIDIEVDQAITELFRSSEADAAAESLLNLPDKARRDGKNYREMWSLSAGRGSSPSTIEKLQHGLDCARCTQSLMFGRSIELAATDPQQALNGLLSLLDGGGSYWVNSSLKMAVDQFPEGTNYGELIVQLPESDSSLGPVGAGKHQMVQRWAESDPASVANFIVGHPDVLDPSYLGTVIATLARTDRTAAIEWVQHFPAGPAFDAAASAAVNYLADSNTSAATELANQIEDEALRQNALRTVKHRANKKTN